MLLSHVHIQIMNTNYLRKLLEKIFVATIPHILYAIFILFVLFLVKYMVHI